MTKHEKLETRLTGISGVKMKRSKLKMGGVRLGSSPFKPQINLTSFVMWMKQIDAYVIMNNVSSVTMKILSCGCEE